jgi:hypothetical protein
MTHYKFHLQSVLSQSHYCERINCFTCFLPIFIPIGLILDTFNYISAVIKMLAFNFVLFVDNI